MRRRAYVVAVMALVVQGCVKPADTPTPADDEAFVRANLPTDISWASVLYQATDLKRLAETPQLWEEARHFSSSAVSNRTVLAHLATRPLGDMDHGFFLNVADVDGGVEATLAEVEGSGVITWIWSANPVGEVCLYIDDRKRPAFTMQFEQFLQSFPAPFSALTGNGYNVHFPILHSDYCRISVRAPTRKHLAELFYQVAWNALPAGQPIQVFSWDRIGQPPGLMEALSRRMTRRITVEPHGLKEHSASLELAVDEEKTVFTVKEPGAVAELTLDAGRKSALKDLWLRVYWDGAAEPQVDVPVSSLCGVSKLCEDVAALPASIEGSTVRVRWYMPFDTAKLALWNAGKTRKTCRVRALLDGEGEEQLRFHCRYQSYGLMLDQKNVVGFDEVYGAGRIVGCTLRVDVRDDEWWGEGDQIIWLDDLKNPIHRGTGTEDYFGFAWCSNITFQHPLRGQTRADGGRSAHRIASMYRYHIMDSLPHRRWAHFQMEAWGLGHGSMDYEIALMSYQSPDASQVR